MESLTARLRLAIRLVVPGNTLPDEAIEYLAENWLLKDGEADMHSIFIGYGFAKGDEAASELGRRVLRQMQETASEAPPPDHSAVTTWLRIQGLEMYTTKTLEWCERMKIMSIAGILDHADQFCADLQLKPLQSKRVRKERQARIFLQDAEAKGYEIFGPLDSYAQYVVSDELGKGGCGRVYRCYLSTACDKKLAVKKIPLSGIRPSADLARVKREIENMQSLEHPHVVRFEDSWETREILYVVMELVEGGDLLDPIIAQGSLSERVARYVFLQLVDALVYIHSKKIIHRDLKVDNILVASNKTGLMTVKISDFGASKLVDDGNSPALTRVGTPQYWAPEVSDPKKRVKGVDQRVDLWSLGVVLYVMLEGRYPFDGADGKTNEENLRKGIFVFRDRSSTSPRARELICKLIQVQPEDRLSLEGCLKHPWVLAEGFG